MGRKKPRRKLDAVCWSGILNEVSKRCNSRSDKIELDDATELNISVLGDKLDIRIQ
jgi:hypothetical protein